MIVTRSAVGDDGEWPREMNLMSDGSGYLADAPDDQVASLPNSVKVVQVLLYVAAGLTLLVIAGGLLTAGMSAPVFGALIWASWPGVLGLIVAVKIKRPSRLKFWLIVIASAVFVFGSLSELGTGDARGVITLVLPLLTFGAVLQHPSRHYFLSYRDERG